MVVSIEIQAILRHYLKLGLKAIEAVCKIWEVEAYVMVFNHIAKNWFNVGDLLIEIKPRYIWSITSKCQMDLNIFRRAKIVERYKICSALYKHYYTEVIYFV